MQRLIILTGVNILSIYLLLKIDVFLLLSLYISHKTFFSFLSLYIFINSFPLFSLSLSLSHTHTCTLSPSLSLIKSTILSNTQNKVSKWHCLWIISSTLPDNNGNYPLFIPDMRIHSSISNQQRVLWWFYS